jgi:hypothetical protein
MRKLRIIAVMLIVLITSCARIPHQSSILEHPETTYYFGSGDFWETEEDLLYVYEDVASLHLLTVEEIVIAAH